MASSQTRFNLILNAQKVTFNRQHKNETEYTLVLTNFTLAD